MDSETIIKEKQGTIVDVRTIEEFRGGNVEGLINIPLQEIERIYRSSQRWRLDEFIK